MSHDLHIEGWCKSSEGEKHIVFNPHARQAQNNAPGVFHSMYEGS